MRTCNLLRSDAVCAGVRPRVLTASSSRDTRAYLLPLVRQPWLWSKARGQRRRAVHAGNERVLPQHKVRFTPAEPSTIVAAAASDVLPHRCRRAQ
eukprot:7247173-Prymnesium_polylepis.1